MSKKGKVTIIGGGVNGICSAYYLHKKGYEVEVIDSGFSEDGTSYGNAGMIVPSHFIPMASPGIIAKGMKWMFSSTSPFYIKPRLDWHLIQWLLRFRSSATSENVQRSQELIWKYNEFSKDEYRKIAAEEDFAFDYHEQGLLMLYKSEKGKKEEVKTAKEAQDLGLEAEVLNAEEVQRLNPHTKTDVLGGVFYPGDAHLYSNQFMAGLKDLLFREGVTFIKGKVVKLHTESSLVNEVELEDKRILPVQELIITAGTWTAKLLRKVGVKLLLEDGKGYSITQENIDLKPTIPSILTEEKVAITPMGNDLRITGTLEISGISHKINHKRVDAFLNAVPKYFPEVIPATSEKIWTGYRPLSFDGVPYVGRSQKIQNCVIASGHGMMGMSLGPGTGKLVSQIISGEPTEIPIELMKPER